MEIVVALIGVLGVAVAGALSFATQVYMRKHLGKSNGQGTVVQMLERVLERQAVHEAEDVRRFALLGVVDDDARGRGGL